MEPDMIRVIGVGLALPAALLFSVIIIYCTEKYVSYQVEKKYRNKKNLS